MWCGLAFVSYGLVGYEVVLNWFGLAWGGVELLWFGSGLVGCVWIGLASMCFGFGVVSF